MTPRIGTPMSHNTPPLSKESIIIPNIWSPALPSRLTRVQSGLRRFVPPALLAGAALAISGPWAVQAASDKKPPARKPEAQQQAKQSPVEAARAIAYLMRVADGACMGVTFDPAPLAKRIDKKGMTPLQVRAKFRDEFQKSYDEAGARVAAAGVGGYCEVVLGSFVSKPKDYPGLKVR